MRRVLVNLLVFVVLLGAAPLALANCRAQIGGIDRPNQVGYIALFSTRSDGPIHPLFASEFWALAGPSDFWQLMAFPVRFTSDVQEVVDKWNWSNYAVMPRIVRVVGNGVMEDDQVWLEIREILQTEESYRHALARYPEAQEGTCGSYFQR